MRDPRMFWLVAVLVIVIIGLSVWAAWIRVEHPQPEAEAHDHNSAVPALTVPVPLARPGGCDPWQPRPARQHAPPTSGLARPVA